MGDRSLQSSIWAPGNRGNENSNFGQRSADWNCGSCGFSNFQWRKECFRCSTPKSGHTPTTNEHPPLTSTSNLAQRPGYTAPATNGNRPRFASNSKPNLHAQPHFNSAENGLATSRWAPRRHSRGEAVQVWTRTVPAPRRSRPPSPSKPPTLPPLRPSRPQSPSKYEANSNTAPDLGLPYQVQHFILAMIQRILEEGCFDFASRWLPQILHEKGWDCSEAVELSTWKGFLPAALPPTAIKPLSNYTLEAALADAVRIRNSAVHRHLCDNNEIRKMALQAQDLMSMFSDTTRQTRFHHLWVEITIWDSKSQEDAVAARAKLERVLREISERPMDDMDWTPNVVSLQELQPGDENAQPMPDHYGDEMELD